LESPFILIWRISRSITHVRRTVWDWILEAIVMSWDKAKRTGVHVCEMVFTCSGVLFVARGG
jgi:hypothetical protein